MIDMIDMIGMIIIIIKMINIVLTIYPIYFPFKEKNFTIYFSYKTKSGASNKQVDKKKKKEVRRTSFIEQIRCS